MFSIITIFFYRDGKKISLSFNVVYNKRLSFQSYVLYMMCYY